MQIPGVAWGDGYDPICCQYAVRGIPVSAVGQVTAYDSIPQIQQTTIDDYAKDGGQAAI